MRPVPDHIASLATLLLIGGILAGTGLGFAASWAWARSQRLEDGARMGVAVGLLVFGLAMAWVSNEMWAVTRLRSGHIEVQGRLVGFEAEKLRETRGGRKLMTRAPVVRFTLADGTAHQFVGLGGSLQRREPGSVVPVHVDPRDPSTALIGDFQNLYSALGLFVLFASVSLLAALHSGLTALLHPDGSGTGPTAPRPRPPRGHDAKAARQALAAAAMQGPAARAYADAADWRTGPAAQRWRTVLRRMAMATALLSIGSIFFTAGVLFVGRAFAITAGGLAAAVALGGAASLLAPGTLPGLSLFGTLIAVWAVGGFAAWLWLLTGI
jgi:hypothetical protein